MSKYNNKQYTNVFWKLPKEIRDVVSSYDTTEHLIKIGKKHNLQIDQLGIMTDITLDVIMGMIATKDFVNELSKELNISSLEASTLVRDIDEEILKPIKETIVALYGDGAPNKPSSSLVQAYEEDDDHPALKKDVLLKEIEDPVPVQVKKEVTENTSLEPRKLRSLEEVDKNTKILERETSQEISEYHQEIEKPIEVRSLERPRETPNQIQKNENFNNPSKLLSSKASKLDDGLNKLAEMKLSKTFIMPKTTGQEGEEKLLAVREENPELKSLGEDTGNKSLITDAKSNTAQAPKIDPYREQI